MVRMADAFALGDGPLGLDIEWRGNTAVLADAALDVVLAKDGAPVGTVRLDAPVPSRVSVSIGLRGIEPGEYGVKLTLTDAGGAEVASAQTPCLVLPPIVSGRETEQ
ncbi:MAG: hypothetical protein GY851_02555 [bacterium]|nr:hypothetical protein [bacterium]